MHKENMKKITIEPSNNIFNELGNNTLDYIGLLSELIDNSIAARDPDNQLQIFIQIFVDENRKAKKFIISDNASGIHIDTLPNAITPAGVQTENSLNEHGLGMKQAIAAIGKLESLVTKTKDSEYAYLIKEFKFGDIEVEEVEVPFMHGTAITIKNVKPIVSTHSTHLTNTVIPYLGARYKWFLKEEKPKISIKMEIVSIEKKNILNSWSIKEIKPIYFHPNTRNNNPIINKFPIKGQGWSAELTFGNIPDSPAEFEELGLAVPNRFSPYHASINNQGLDIVMHNRVILFHQLSQLNIIGQRHNDYNHFRGEINLKSGFQTSITKNTVISDDNFRECIEMVKGILSGQLPGPLNKMENLLKGKKFPNELPEILLRDRLIEWLKTNPIQPRKVVSKEYAVEGVDGYIDIHADNEAWELKKDQANALDVYQLFMYMDIGKIAKGYLLAKSFAPGAQVAAAHLKQNHGKEVVLTMISQFPIGHAPDEKERVAYY
jgi:Histidine kinase-, DNA gyrase B-, and HSP90-like ATPase